MTSPYDMAEWICYYLLLLTKARLVKLNYFVGTNQTSHCVQDQVRNNSISFTIDRPTSGKRHRLHTYKVKTHEVDVI